MTEEYDLCMEVKGYGEVTVLDAYSDAEAALKECERLWHGLENFEKASMTLTVRAKERASDGSETLRTVFTAGGGRENG